MANKLGETLRALRGPLVLLAALGFIVVAVALGMRNVSRPEPVKETAEPPHE